MIYKYNWEFYAWTKKHRQILYPVILCVVLLIALIPYSVITPTRFSISNEQALAATTVPIVHSSTYTFSQNETIEEAQTELLSSSPSFWLDSGGQLIIKNGIAMTMQGPASLGSRWQVAYNASSRTDTDNGKFPQNLFRLVTRDSTWNQVSQELRFEIKKLNMTETPNRDGYSGILFFNRYHDGDNLYYSGIRMDGTAIIKKKINGIYYTLATAQVFNSESGYDRNTNPNLIPGNRFMRIKSEVKDLPNGDVLLTFWVDKTDSGIFTKVLTTTDKKGLYGGTNVIKGPGRAGIRTDYLDVLFDYYKVYAI